MQTNGIVRSYMQQVMSSEDFLKYVAGIMENQLHEWDVNYEVFVMKWPDYEMVVKNGEKYYHAELSVQDLEVLHLKGLFELDKRLWIDLMEKVLPFGDDYGNYLSTVFHGAHKA
ncbi:hypothetical protein FZC78_02920 [Rossellomorea vietnamensis]|uniref:Uncharacterized protein n=1 Tax=Rossellomorea vietnamensis TaxID=218284 RepID=A0A5D4NYP4_9BACI|nr:hypothetical protein [Rossellomorea vietnamensis]TYS18506.1 hypothetical protein FZC78_02920 [Rossellomorea vietnamensis]